MDNSYGIKREQREFYLTSGRKVTGLSCQEPNYWYIRSEGSSLYYGDHLFNTKLEALLKGQANLATTIEEVGIRLREINQLIKIELNIK